MELDIDDDAASAGSRGHLRAQLVGLPILCSALKTPGHNRPAGSGRCPRVPETSRRIELLQLPPNACKYFIRQPLVGFVDERKL